MAALTAVRAAKYDGLPMRSNSFPVAASTTIYEGAAVSLDGSGNAIPLTTGDIFVGFAKKTIENTTAEGFGSAGDLNVEVWCEGVMEMTVASSAATSVAALVYLATDNPDDADLADAGSDVEIGKVHRFLSVDQCEVAFCASSLARSY